MDAQSKITWRCSSMTQKICCAAMGSAGPDAEIGIHTIEQYRAGTLPVPLVPLQKDAASGQ